MTRTFCLAATVAAFLASPTPVRGQEAYMPTGGALLPVGDPCSIQPDCGAPVFLMIDNLYRGGYRGTSYFLAVAEDVKKKIRFVLMIRESDGDYIIEPTGPVSKWFKFEDHLLMREVRGGSNTWVSLQDVQPPLTVGSTAHTN